MLRTPTLRQPYFPDSLYKEVLPNRWAATPLGQ